MNKIIKNELKNEIPDDLLSILKSINKLEPWIGSNN
jgi:hypothetical protein